MQGEIIETMQFMLSPYGRRVSNLEDLASCLDKMTLLAEEEDRIIEAREEAPPSVPQFERQQFDMLGRSVETQGLGRRRESVDAEAHVIPAMPERQHGMYYTPDQSTQESSQMSPLYSYPYQRYSTTVEYGLQRRWMTVVDSNIVECRNLQRRCNNDCLRSRSFQRSS